VHPPVELEDDISRARGLQDRDEDAVRLAKRSRLAAALVVAATVSAAAAAFAASLDVSSDTITAYTTSLTLQTTTTTTPASATCTINATEDTYISSVSATTANGGATFVRVDRRDSPTTQVKTVQALVKFPASGGACVEGGTMPSGKTVLSATLSLYVAAATSDSVGVCPAAATWSESTTWSTANAHLTSRTACSGTTSIVNVTGLTLNTRALWVVSAHVSTQGVAPTDGWIVRNTSSTSIGDSSGHVADFAARETTNPPRLIITYTP
jgi:hypothetical protein